MIQTNTSIKLFVNNILNEGISIFKNLVLVHMGHLDVVHLLL